MTRHVGTHQTVQQWHNAVRIAHMGHIEAAKKCARMHRSLGTLAVVLGAICATAVFWNIRQSPKLWVQVAAGAVVLVAACVGAVNTFLDYSGRAGRHQSAATGYGGLRRELEQRQVAESVDDDFLERFRVEWTRLDREAPTMPPKVYDRAHRAVTGRLPSSGRRRLVKTKSE